jgi:hypothetical protein
MWTATAGGRHRRPTTPRRAFQRGPTAQPPDRSPPLRSSRRYSAAHEIVMGRKWDVALRSAIAGGRYSAVQPPWPRMSRDEIGTYRSEALPGRWIVLWARSSHRSLAARDTGPAPTARHVLHVTDRGHEAQERRASSTEAGALCTLDACNER